MHTSPSFDTSSRLSEDQQRGGAAASVSNAAGRPFSNHYHTSKRARLPSHTANDGGNALHHAVSLNAENETFHTRRTSAAISTAPHITHQVHGMGDFVSSAASSKLSKPSSFVDCGNNLQSIHNAGSLFSSDEDEVNVRRATVNDADSKRNHHPASTIGGDGSLASSGYQTDQQHLPSRISVSNMNTDRPVGKRTSISSTASTTQPAEAVVATNSDNISITSTSSSLQLHSIVPIDYRYYNHRIDWRRYEPGVNMSMVLHDPKHAKRQQNFFTKHWGEQFMPQPLDRFTSSTALSKSKHLIRLYTAACNINKEHFRTYLDELQRRDKRAKRHHQHQRLMMMSSSASMYGDESTSRAESPTTKLLSKSATSASLQFSSDPHAKFSRMKKNRFGSISHATDEDSGEDGVTSEVIFMRNSTAAADDDSRRRRRLSVELEGIPKVFFDAGFALQVPGTFAQVIPWSLFTTPAQKQPSGKPTDQTTNLSVRIHHDKLSHFMDLIEIQMAQHVAERAEGFFSAVMRHDVLRAGIGATAAQITAARIALADVDRAVLAIPEQLQRAHARRERCSEILRIATAVNAVYQTQPTLQHLLAQADYLAALEVLQTTRDVLANDAILTRVNCFRHLEGQLSNMEAAVERMCSDEFVKCLGALWNQPVRVQELVELIFADDLDAGRAGNFQRKSHSKDDGDDNVMGVSVKIKNGSTVESSCSNVFLTLVSEQDLIKLDACTFTSAFMALLKMKQTEFIYAFRSEAIAALQASLKLIICETLAACDHRTSSPLLGRSAGNNIINNSLTSLKNSSRPASAASSVGSKNHQSSCTTLKIDVHQMYATVNAMPFIDWVRLLERMCATSLCVLQRIHYTALLMQQCIEEHFCDAETKIQQPEEGVDANAILRTRLLLGLNDECIAMFGSRVQDALVDIVHERLVMLFPLFAAGNLNNNDAGKTNQQYSTKLALEYFDQIWRILNTFCNYIERQKMSMSISFASSYRTSILRAFMHDFGSNFLAHYFHAEIKLEKLELLLQNESWEPALAVPAEYQRFFTALERERDKVLFLLENANQANVPILALLPDSAETLHLSGNIIMPVDNQAQNEVVSSIQFGGVVGDDKLNSMLVLPGVAVLFVQMLVKYCHKAAQYRALADEVLRLLVDLMKHFNSRLCQLILGAGAVLQPAARSQATESGNSPTPAAPAASANRKSNISSRDLVLSWQCLQLLIALIPFIRTHFQYLLGDDDPALSSNPVQRNSKQKRALINKLKVLAGDLRDHQQRNMAKIVAVMRGLIVRSLATWQVRAPTPSAAFQQICSKLQSLHANLTALLGPTQLGELFDAIHVQFKAALHSALVQQQVRRDGGPKHGLVAQDLAYYARVMRQLNPTFCDAEMKDLWP